MKDAPRLPVKEHDHETPTVIHKPEQDMTLLARWLQNGMEQGPRFWLLLVGVIAGVIGLFALGSTFSAGRSADGQAWAELIPAKTVEDRLQIAESFPHTPVAQWAKLQAAAEEYQEGIYSLFDPKQRDLLGSSKLKKALEYFKQVAEDAPKDSPVALSASLGIGRTLEALNKLPEAIKQYQLVAETWKGTPEAKQAEALAKALEDPETVTFYRELYAYQAPATPTTTGTLPGSILDFTRPGGGTDFINPGATKSFLPNMKPPADLDAPPPPTGPVPANPTEPGKAETPTTPAKPPEVPTTPAKPTDIPVIPPEDPASKPAPPK